MTSDTKGIKGRKIQQIRLIISIFVNQPKKVGLLLVLCMYKNMWIKIKG